MKEDTEIQEETSNRPKCKRTLHLTVGDLCRLVFTVLLIIPLIVGVNTAHILRYIGSGTSVQTQLSSLGLGKSANSTVTPAPEEVVQVEDFPVTTLRETGLFLSADGDSVSATIPAGSELLVLRYPVQGLCKVRYKGEEGYVSLKAFQAEETLSSPEAPAFAEETLSSPEAPEPAEETEPVEADATETPPEAAEETAVLLNSQQQEEGNIAMWMGDNTNFYRYPKTDSEIMYILRKGTSVVWLCDEGDEWSKILAFGNLPGYVRRTSLTDIQPPPVTPDPMGFLPCNDVVWAADNISLYTDRGISKITSVEQHAALSRTGTSSDGWSRVSYKGQDAYCQTSQLLTENPGVEPDTAIGGSATQTAHGGQMYSLTGVPLNLMVRWTSKANDNGSVTLTVDCYAHSCGLNAVAAANNLRISVDDKTTTLSVGALNVEGNSTVDTHIGSYTFTVSSGAHQLSAEWDFNGVYSGVYLSTVRAAAFISVR